MIQASVVPFMRSLARPFSCQFVNASFSRLTLIMVMVIKISVIVIVVILVVVDGMVEIVVGSSNCSLNNKCSERNNMMIIICGSKFHSHRNGNGIISNPIMQGLTMQ